MSLSEQPSTENSARSINHRHVIVVAHHLHPQGGIAARGRVGIGNALPRASKPPVTNPVYIELYQSCLALCFSMTHSMPAYSKPIVANDLEYDLQLDFPN
jgi:hypothetical protein